MIKIKAILVCILIFNYCTAKSQSSYTRLEKRFNKSVLSAQDSLAFKKQGLQKAQQLFYQTNLYLQNSQNLSNQAYIAQRIPQLFYKAEEDTAQFNAVMEEVRQIQAQPNFEQTEFSWLQPPKGKLARLQTTNTQPALQFDLILIKEQKKFGDLEEAVWQVFLTNPQILKPKEAN